MSQQRLFHSTDHFQPSAEGEPIRSVVSESADAVIVAWFVSAGQTIPSHVHPHGQDTWTLLSGSGDYALDAEGGTCRIVAGDVVVAPVGAVHGVHNPGPEPLRFISVVSPGDAGYERL